MKQLTREAIQRMVGSSLSSTSVGGSGGGGGGGGGGQVDYAAEAGHALTADEATHAASADEATHAGSATEAQNLATDSTDWLKIARKDIAQTIAEVWTFAKGLVATLRSYFNGGVTITKPSGDTGNALVVTGGTGTDTLTVTDDASIGDDLTVSGGVAVGENVLIAGSLGTSAVPVPEAYVDDLNAKNINAKDITTEYLTVTKAAHFFRLVIDELMSNKGAVIITSANAKVFCIQTSSTNYILYFRATDGDGGRIDQSWRHGDRAICQTFDGVHQGENQSVQSKYYWAKVTAVSASTVYVKESTVTPGVASDVKSTPQTDPLYYECHYIRLSFASGDFIGISRPEGGDEVVQLGYDPDDDPSPLTGKLLSARQGAIILSAYETPDTDLTPPLIAQYRGIKTFALSGYRASYFDATSADFIGSFRAIAGGMTVEEEMEAINNDLIDIDKTVGELSIQPNNIWLGLSNKQGIGGANLLQGPVLCQANSAYWAFYGSGVKAFTIDEGADGVNICGAKIDISPTGGVPAALTTSINGSIAQTLTLKPSTTYVLSLYVRNSDYNPDAKAADQNTQTNMLGLMVYNHTADEEVTCISAGMTDQGESTKTTDSGEGYGRGVFVIKDSKWHRIWFVFATPATVTGTHSIIFRAHRNGSEYMGNDWRMRMPKLEAGLTPTAWSAINDSLSETGINIERGEITLRGNKVSFQNSAGSLATPKIWIDPTSGALNAVDGNFQGTVKASIIYQRRDVVAVGDINPGNTDVDSTDILDACTDGVLPNILILINDSDGDTNLPADLHNFYKEVHLPAASSFKGFEMDVYATPMLKSSSVYYRYIKITNDDGDFQNILGGYNMGHIAGFNPTSYTFTKFQDLNDTDLLHIRIVSMQFGTAWKWVIMNMENVSSYSSN